MNENKTCKQILGSKLSSTIENCLIVSRDKDTAKCEDLVYFYLWENDDKWHGCLYWSRIEANMMELSSQEIESELNNGKISFSDGNSSLIALIGGLRFWCIDFDPKQEYWQMVEVESTITDGIKCILENDDINILFW